jgi:hypothetical protein
MAAVASRLGMTVTAMAAEAGPLKGVRELRDLVHEHVPANYLGAFSDVEVMA